MQRGCIGVFNQDKPALQTQILVNLGTVQLIRGRIHSKEKVKVQTAKIEPVAELTQCCRALIATSLNLIRNPLRAKNITLTQDKHSGNPVLQEQILFLEHTSLAIVSGD